MAPNNNNIYCFQNASVRPCNLYTNKTNHFTLKKVWPSISFIYKYNLYFSKVRGGGGGGGGVGGPTLARGVFNFFQGVGQIAISNGNP